MSARDKRKRRGHGVNAKGRSKSHRWVQLDLWMLMCPAWQALTPDAVAVLIAVWTRYNGINNGQIAFSQRDAQDTLKSSERRAINALRDLQAKGFLHLHRKGGFNIKGRNPANEWEITALPVPGPKGGHSGPQALCHLEALRNHFTDVTTTPRGCRHGTPIR